MEINEVIQLIIKDNLNHNDNFIDLIEKKNVDEILNIICITFSSFCGNIDTVIKENIRNEIINNLLQKKEVTLDIDTNIYKIPLNNIKKEVTVDTVTNIYKIPLNNVKTVEKKAKKKKILIPEGTVFPDQIIKHSVFWQNLNEQQKIEHAIKRVKKIQSIEQLIQRSLEWYTFRYGMLTASDLYKAIGTPGIRRSLILKKSKPLDISNKQMSGLGKACKHGIKFEDVAIQVYEKMKNVIIEDYGCIQHSEFKIFGASPDGICSINSKNKRLIGRMLEIKCPSSRVIVEGEVPSHYWKQIQGQLEVCKLWECDYLECKIVVIEQEEFSITNKERGIVLTIANINKPGESYIYSPLDLSNEEYENWIDKEYDKLIANEDLIFISKAYWCLEKYNCVLVERDYKWFNYIKPDIEKFWEEVEYYRKNGTKELEKKIKKRKKKDKNAIFKSGKCLISD